MTDTVGPKMAPGRLEALLNSLAGLSLPPQARRRALIEITKLKRTLRHRVCSEPWFEHCWNTGERFPPRADHTPMQLCQCHRCQRTGQLWPAFYEASVKPQFNREPRQNQQNHALSYECYLESLSDWEAA